jgi:hypothetical protein
MRVCFQRRSFVAERVLKIYKPQSIRLLCTHCHPEKHKMLTPLQLTKKDTRKQLKEALGQLTHEEMTKQGSSLPHHNAFTLLSLVQTFNL